MQKFIKTLFISSILFNIPFSYAQEAQQSPLPVSQNGAAVKPEKCDMMDPEKTTAHLKKMQEHMLAMHDLSTKILAETDPAKKQALMDQQLELLRAHHMEKMSNHRGEHEGHKKH